MATITLYPTADTYIYEGGADTNHGTSTYLEVLSWSAHDIRGILSFSGADIAGATINSATLYLYYYSKVNNPVGRTYKANRMTRLTWTETGATWNKYDGSTVWTAAGGDYTATGAASATVPADFGWMDWNVATIVQTMATAGTDLHFLIKDNTEDAVASIGALFYSKDYTGTTYDPYLAIDYTPIEKTFSDLFDAQNLTETFTIEKVAYSYTPANNNQAYILNMKTGEWTYCDNAPFTNLVYRPRGLDMFASRRDKGQVCKVNYGTTFDGTHIDSTWRTGFLNFGKIDEVKALGDEASEGLTLLREFISEAKGEGDLTLTVFTEQDPTTGKTFTIDLTTIDNTIYNIIQTALSRDIRGKYVSFQIENTDIKTDADFWLGEMKVKIKKRRIR